MKTQSKKLLNIHFKLFVLIMLVVTSMTEYLFPGLFDFDEKGIYKYGGYGKILPILLTIEVIIHVILIMLYSLFFEKAKGRKEKFFNDL